MAEIRVHQKRKSYGWVWLLLVLLVVVAVVVFILYQNGSLRFSAGLAPDIPSLATVGTAFLHPQHGGTHGTA